MIIIEYKMNIEPDGTLVHPGWVHSSGWFFNPSDNTYIGTALEEADRNYYLPDSVTELTVDTLKSRVQSLAYLKVEDTNGYTKTVEDINSEVDAWISKEIGV